MFFLIDDDADDQEIFQLSLQEVDPALICITANDGREAIEIITHDENFLPDIIFLDLNMPRMNGKECLAEIRGIPRFNNVPIYMYSTSMSDKDKQDTLNLGAKGFITKPNSTKELVKILAELTVKS